MIIVRDLSSISSVSNIAIRSLVQQRIDDLGDDAFDTDTPCYFLIVEASDTLQSLSLQLGFPVLCNRMTGLRYDQSGFTPSFEFMEEYPDCFDTVFVLSDDGSAVELFIPKEPGMDADLLAMCQTFAVQVRS